MTRRRTHIGAMLMALLTLIAMPALASIELKKFDSPEQEALYRDLIAELSCLVYQNQNLADSNAELAVDLRRQTFEMVSNGANKQDVVDFMVARYGEFVLYRPPFNASTLFLWVGPFIFLIASVLILLKIIRGRRQESPAKLDAKAQAEVRSLLDE